jgi:hypothetical protein
VLDVGCSSNYYNLPLKEIQVQGVPLKVDASIFDKKYGTVLDSGTTYAYLPSQAFDAFEEAVSDSSCALIGYLGSMYLAASLSTIAEQIGEIMKMGE